MFPTLGMFLHFTGMFPCTCIWLYPNFCVTLSDYGMIRLYIFIVRKEFHVLLNNNHTTQCILSSFQNKEWTNYCKLFLISKSHLTGYVVYFSFKTLPWAIPEAKIVKEPVSWPADPRRATARCHTPTWVPCSECPQVLPWGLHTLITVRDAFVGQYVEYRTQKYNILV